MSKNESPEQRSLRARQAAHILHSRYDSKQLTARARRGFPESLRGRGRPRSGPSRARTVPKSRAREEGVLHRPVQQVIAGTQGKTVMTTSTAPPADNSGGSSAIVNDETEADRVTGPESSKELETLPTVLPTNAGRNAKGVTAKSAAPVLTGDVADGEVVDRVLAEDAAAIRALLEERDQAIGSAALEIANRLAAVREREHWSTRELAQWAKSEDMSFGSHVRVQQILGWRETVLELQAANVVTGPLPDEWALRPLTQAKSQGRLDEKQAATTFTEVTGGGSKAPTHSAVEKAVQKVAKPKAQPAPKTAEPKTVEPKTPPTFPVTSSARVLIEIDSGTPHSWSGPPTTFLAEWEGKSHPGPAVLAEFVTNLRSWIAAIEEVIEAVENAG